MSVRGVVWVGALLCAGTGCAHPSETPPPVEPTQPAPREIAAPSPQRPRGEGAQVGYATWYGASFAGRKTASGERFDPNRMTAAHRTLPFGTWVEVKRVDTGESVRVRITDRGPFGHAERIIDLSRAAAQVLRIIKNGPTRVNVRVVAGP